MSKRKNNNTNPKEEVVEYKLTLPNSAETEEVPTNNTVAPVEEISDEEKLEHMHGLLALNQHEINDMLEALKPDESQDPIPQPEIPPEILAEMPIETGSSITNTTTLDNTPDVDDATLHIEAVPYVIQITLGTHLKYDKLIQICKRLDKKGIKYRIDKNDVFLDEQFNTMIEAVKRRKQLLALGIRSTITQ